MSEDSGERSFFSDLDKIEKEGKCVLTSVFLSINFAIGKQEKPIVIILIGALPKLFTIYNYSADDSESLALLSHCESLVNLLTSEAAELKLNYWEEICNWRSQGKPSFILDFEALRDLAGISVH